ncbi:MAG: SGNH/GDSL hydrolase family protein [Firmicutes bacterium]|nr:SGNH/GDSL hydrolase family protein [Bacillota bacterium]
MKNILCFGDSNTWGYRAEDEGRYDWSTRYPGLLQQMLGADWRVIEEGLNGRTIACDDVMFGNKNGMQHMQIALETHRPLDLITIMLGTNDQKSRFALNATDIAYAMSDLVSQIKAFPFGLYSCPEILVICPPLITEDIHNATFGPIFGQRAVELSPQIAGEMKRLVPGVHFLDASTLCRPGSVDGLHLNEAGHKALAEGLYAKVLEIFA